MPQLFFPIHIQLKLVLKMNVAVFIYISLSGLRKEMCDLVEDNGKFCLEFVFFFKNLTSMASLFNINLVV